MSMRRGVVYEPVEDASASVGTPICSSKRETGSWAVTMVGGEPAPDHPSRTLAFIAVSLGLVPPACAIQSITFLSDTLC